MKALPRLDAWPALPLALAAALAGQALLLAGLSLAGGLLYAAAAALLLWGKLEDRREGSGPAADLPRGPAILALMALLLVAFVLRRVYIGVIPWGLNNDEGIEGLIACRFLSGERISPFSSIGLSRETLYHVLLMPLFRLLGPSIGALRLLSLLAALASVALIAWVGKELFSARAGLLAAALLALSPWHLLYSRSGLRNILLPVFLLASLGLFHRALRTRRLALFAATGLALGVGMYSYTSFRVIPGILLLWALLRRWLLKREAMAWKEILAVGAPFIALLIPMMAVALRDPAEFLARGFYVLTQAPEASLATNLLYSALVPALIAARYGVVQSRYYFGDGVSLVYAVVGRNPETAVSGALMLCGLVVAGVRAVRCRAEEEGVLLLSYLATTLAVGVAGPSLTRLIGNLPILCLAGALFLEALARGVALRFRPRAGAAVVGLLLVATGALSCDQYFRRAGTSGKAMFYYAAPQTLIGLYAASRVPDHPVYVFATEQPETLQFLTFTRRQWVTLSQDPAALDLERVRSALGHQEFVLENHRRFLGLFRTLAQSFPGADSTTLSDARQRIAGNVAYVLDILPASRRPPASAQPPLPDPSSSPPARP